MSAEEGQVSDGQINSEPEGGLESGEESDHDSARPRQNVHHPVRQGVNQRYRPRPAHGPDRGGHRRSNWRGYGRGDAGRRPQGRSGERHDRNGHVPRPRYQHRPAPPRRDTAKRDVPVTAKSRSASRERHVPSRENSCSLEQDAPKQDAAGGKVHQVELARMQQLITLDTVGVAAAKQSFKHMCTVLAQGLDIQHLVWSAERDRGQAASLYRDPDWEGMRSRLLSGLKAIHLVCTAGLVDEEHSICLGLSTLQKACTMSAALTNLRRPQQMHEVQAWCSSLSALLNGTHAQPSPSKPQSPAGLGTTPGAGGVAAASAKPGASPAAGVNTAASTHALSEQQEDGCGSAPVCGSPTSSSASEPADGPGKGGGADAVSTERGGEAQAPAGHSGQEGRSPAAAARPGLLNVGQTSEQATDAGFKPRVMFRLDIGGASAGAAPELVTPSASPPPSHHTPRPDPPGAQEDPAATDEAAVVSIQPVKSPDAAAGAAEVVHDAREVSRATEARPLQGSGDAVDVLWSPVSIEGQQEARQHADTPAEHILRDGPQPAALCEATPTPQAPSTVREQPSPMAQQPSPVSPADTNQSTQQQDPCRQPGPAAAHLHAEPQAAAGAALPPAPAPPSSVVTPKGLEAQAGAEEATPKPKRRSRWDMRGTVAPPAEPSSAAQPPLHIQSPAREQSRAAPPQEPRSSERRQERSPERCRWSERSPQPKAGYGGAQKRARMLYEDEAGRYDKARFRREDSRPAQSPRESATKRISRERSADRRPDTAVRRNARSPRSNGAAKAPPGGPPSATRPPPLLPPLPPIAVSAPKPGGGVCVEEEPVTPPSADEGDQGAPRTVFQESAVPPPPGNTSGVAVASSHAGSQSEGTSDADKKQDEGRRRAAAPVEARVFGGNGSAVSGGGVRHMSPVSPPSSAGTQPPGAVDRRGARVAADRARSGDTRSATQKVEPKMEPKVEPKASDGVPSRPRSLSPVTPPDSPRGAPSVWAAKPSAASGPRQTAGGAGQGVQSAQPPPPPKEDSLQSNGLSSSARLSPHCVDSVSEHVPVTCGEHTTPPQPPEAPVESNPSNGDFAPPHPATDPVRALVSEGRLLLLVNLEGTLIDVAKPSSVEKWPPEQQHQLQLTVASQSPSDTSLLQLPGSLLWIKMRPGWQQCMYRLACAYALRLVSDLKPEVVSQIRRLMDPHEHLFDSAVQSSSRFDAKKKPVRQLQHASGFPALSPIALVLDNKQSQLWHAPDMPHVMHCERYCFFPRPSMGTAAPCLLAAGRDEAAHDSVLLYATEALLRTHTRFYQKLLAPVGGVQAYRSTSVCNVMAEELATILKGCKLLLASCTSSLKEKQVDHLLDLGRLFGATWLNCATSDPEADQVTHIIALSPDSSEVAWGTETQRPVVKPAWLLYCGITWTRVQEDEFAII